jgi:hypothetical protein
MSSAAAASERAMNTTGPGTFYDGLTSARHAVTVTLDDSTVRIGSADGATLAEWRTADIAPVSTPEGVLRVGLAGGPATARLEIHDEALAAAVVAAARPCDRTGMTDAHTRHRVAIYSLVAIAVLTGAGIWGVPVIADQVTPRLPITVDERIGIIANAEARRELEGETKGKPFECSAGNSAKEEASRAAFNKLVGTLRDAAALPLPTEVTMVHVSEINAVTVPGGFIYVYEGILDKAMRVDEIAGVIGHEMGHVNNRDGTKSAVQTGGLSLLFGMLLGDFTGGGAVVVTGTKLLSEAYSRKAESAADLFGAQLMAKIGGDPHALGDLLLRMAGSPGPTDHFLLDHPEAQIRAAAIDRVPQPSPMKALLTPDEWTALQSMCKEQAP